MPSKTSRPSTFDCILSKVYHILLYGLPVTLFFSYHPVLSLGSNSFMNFELSIPLIWLVLFDLAAFLMLVRASRLPLLSDRRFFLFSLFPLYTTLSSFWSASPLRALLTAGVIWLVFFAVFAIIFITPSRSRRFSLPVFLVSSLLVCLFCFLQSVLDLCGLDRSATLLCAGCTYKSFGFPHPSGFAIEPQFMGGLLLAPTLLALYLCSFDKSREHGVKSEHSHSKFSTITHFCTEHFRALMLILACVFSLTLFFTFSRGAIYAYAVALVILITFACIRRRRSARQQPRLTPLILVPVLTFFAALGLQGLMAQLGPTTETFSSATAKSIHHLSLGIIDFRSQPGAAPAPATSIDSAPSAIEADFNGYVAASTDIRLGLNSVALATWSSSPGNLLFGVGLGGAGTAMHALYPTEVTSAREIVQNEPLSLLLELGLTGVILAIFSLLVAFAPQIFPPRFLDGRSTPVKKKDQALVLPPSFWSRPALPLLLALGVAYLITMQFFSGLPNALHLYLLIPILF